MVLSCVKSFIYFSLYLIIMNILLFLAGDVMTGRGSRDDGNYRNFTSQWNKNCWRGKNVNGISAACHRGLTSGIRKRYSQTFTIKILEELGFPGEISVTPSTEASNRKVPIDAHTPHVVSHSFGELPDARDIVTPVLEGLPVRLGDSNFDIKIKVPREGERNLEKIET